MVGLADSDINFSPICQNIPMYGECTKLKLQSFTAKREHLLT